jgi:hypothetical protein
MPRYAVHIGKTENLQGGGYATKFYIAEQQAELALLLMQHRDQIAQITVELERAPDVD